MVFAVKSSDPLTGLIRSLVNYVTRDGLNHQVLKRKGGLDLAMSGLDLAGPNI